MTVKQAGAMGGRARAAKELPGERKARMKRVALARWKGMSESDKLEAMQPALAHRWNGRRKKSSK